MKSYPFFYSLYSSRWEEKLCLWADKNFRFFAFTSGNNHVYPSQPFDSFFFAGNKELSESEIWQTVKLKVGVIGYDYKNRIEKLNSDNLEFFPLPELCFFEPELIFKLDAKGIYSSSEIPKAYLNEIEAQILPANPSLSCQVSPQVTRDEYLRSVLNIQNEILEGNTYETNFCQAFSGSFASWAPIAAFFRLNELSKMPFAALFKAKNQWLLSASPERFLKKTGSKLIAQPIKGTIKRGLNPEEDAENREKLISSEKERAENLMITDLMRNDLARVSKTGSVRVEELFGIYPFPRVLQMISTVSSEIKDVVTFENIIRATFPMGSMTGAPKISTMKIIEREECFRRGWFSGAFGWIDENEDFDFSVVIRSIIADLEVKKLYFGVGSAITIDASAEQEYDECELKAQALFELLRGN
ncbi:anthranilate synthase component I family protein [Algoriphagus boritolerans]|uniref:Para-aminobenzoate synthetase component 1 n=1 Tax=Algoriphagus boritolerans DSM 17298 = JCM 18970 TaxID=1120964 RepID=A0A1H5XDX4_9BACT|nr:anthranilate synthase component I family protein [Algoriphagus boritolerans]SEG09919.1 para-aminobenzoate synthetase component 1 [Algoriphagus boritolerans DSM 17298 = JCM 18970]